MLHRFVYQSLRCIYTMYINYILPLWHGRHVLIVGICSQTIYHLSCIYSDLLPSDLFYQYVGLQI